MSANSTVIEEDVELVVSILQDLAVVQYVAVVSAVILVYDYFLLFSDEVNLVWRSRWHVPKVLFMLNRYLPFVDVFILLRTAIAGGTATECLHDFKVASWFMMAGFCFSQFVLMLRTWAIWERRHIISVFLVTLIVGSIGADIYVLNRYLEGLSYMPIPGLPNLASCPLLFANRIIYADFVMIIALETIMLGLLVVKAVQIFRQSRSPVMVRMYQDGVYYYFFILAASIANVVAILIAPADMNNFLIVFQRVIHSVLCSRVLLHIRGAISPDAAQYAAPPQHSFFNNVSSSAGAAEALAYVHTLSQHSRHSYGGHHLRRVHELDEGDDDSYKGLELVDLTERGKVTSQWLD